MAVSQSLTLTQISQDAGANTSQVRILWTSTQTGDSYNANTKTAYYYVSVNGGPETQYAVSYTLPNGTTKTIADAAVTVRHDDEGACTVAVRTWMATGISAGEVELSKSLTLTPIPRSSTIGATDANIGAVSMIAVTKQSSAYTHSIAYQFGTLSGYITSSGGVSASEVQFSAASVAFTVPTTFYAQIPNAKTGVCTLTIRTYSGTTQIGETKTCAFTATAAESSCKPAVSGTVADSNETTKALTGDASKLIRYYSTALCTITATAKNSAAISSKSIGGTEVTGTTRSIANVESGSVVFAAADSRGYSNAATVTASMVAYVKLTNNAVGTRTDPTSGNATLSIKGDYYNGSFGAASNTLSVTWRISGGTAAAVTPTVSGNTYSASVPLTGLDYTKSYTYEVTVSDKLASVTKTVTIGLGVPVFDWGKDNFFFHVPVYADVVNPKSIELRPGADAGHGGYIDFHHNGTVDGTEDYTSRIIDINGTLYANGSKILTSANVIAVYNTSVAFTDGIATYSNSAITAYSVCIVQRRVATAGSANVLAFGTTSNSGSVTIAASSNVSVSMNLNILIINP